MKGKLFLGIYLFILGLAGVLSLLTMNIPLPEKAEQILLEQFSPDQIKVLLLVNPTILLAFTTMIGVLTFSGAGFKLPVFEKLTGLSKLEINLQSILSGGVAGGVIAGVLIVSISQLFESALPSEFSELSSDIEPTILNRILYGGITEEILMRFGLMSLVAWTLVKLTKSQKSIVYWTAILVSSILFGLGHLPAVFQTIDSPSTLLITYIILGNAAGGIIFGWLYWRRGLLAAMLAHMFAHFTMLGLERII